MGAKYRRIVECIGLMKVLPGYVCLSPGEAERRGRGGEKEAGWGWQREGGLSCIGRDR